MKNKYSKPTIVVKTFKENDFSNRSFFFANEDSPSPDFYSGIGDIVTIGIKRERNIGMTVEDCKKKGGEFRRVYGKNPENSKQIEVSVVCEFKKNGKKSLEKIQTEITGSYVGIPISKVDDVIKNLKKQSAKIK